jgi:hypothetical protein
MEAGRVMVSRSDRGWDTLRNPTEANTSSIPCPHLTSQSSIPFKSCSPYTFIHFEVGMRHLPSHLKASSIGVKRWSFMRPTLPVSSTRYDYLV